MARPYGECFNDVRLKLDLGIQLQQRNKVHLSDGVATQPIVVLVFLTIFVSLAIVSQLKSQWNL